MEFSHSSWKIFGGINIPNSPSLIDAEGNIHIRYLGGSYDDYLTGLLKLRSYWSNVRELERYTWNDFEFLRHYSEGPYVRGRPEKIDAKIVEKPERSRNASLLVAHLNRVTSLLISDIDKARNHVDRIIADLKPAVDITTGIQKRYIAARKEAFSKETDKITSKTLGFLRDDPDSLDKKRESRNRILELSVVRVFGQIIA